MNVKTADRLSELTSDFYAQVGESFSSTRGSAWPGWGRVLAEAGLAEDSRANQLPLRVLDLSCGNLRFERLLAERLGGRRIEATCVDECDVMARPLDLTGIDLSYVHCDVAAALRDGFDVQVVVGRDRFDLAVCFGFLHHLPLAEQRRDALRVLVSCLGPGGVAAVSLWQLSHSPTLLAKAERVTAERAPALGLTDLGSGDYLLGWQDRTDVLRYCHDFSEAEVDDLVASVEPYASEVARFSADGRTGDLNRYLVLRCV